VLFERSGHRSPCQDYDEKGRRIHSTGLLHCGLRYGADTLPDTDGRLRSADPSRAAQKGQSVDTECRAGTLVYSTRSTLASRLTAGLTPPFDALQTRI